MRYNGSDDWLLWLLMLGNGLRFALNPAVIYVHCYTGRNTSSHYIKMRQSDREMAGILLQSGALTSRFLRWEMRRKISIEKKFRGDESLLSKGLSRLTSPIQLFLRAAWWLRTRIERRLC